MDKHIKTAHSITQLLENRFKIGGYSFGLDPILGLFAGAGDLVTALIGLYFIWIGKQLNIPNSKLLQMVWNLFIDFAVGSIPFLGDIFDFAFKAHSKNMKILQEYHEGRLIA